MAGGHRFVVREDIGDRQAAIADAFGEVGHVVAWLFAFAEVEDRVVGEWVVFEVFDEVASDLAAVDEDRSVFPFEEDTVVEAEVVGSVADDQLDVIWIRDVDAEFGRDVVTVVFSGHAVFERDGMDDVVHDWGDLCWAFVAIENAEGPGGDVDVVCAPVGHFAAGVFVPPAEFVVAAFRAVRGFRSLAEPHVPVEVVGDFDDGLWVTGRSASDGAGDFLEFAEASGVSEGDELEEHAPHFAFSQ